MRNPGRRGERRGRRRDEKQDREEEEEEERGRQSSRYTEQRGFSVCHIRTVGSVWNLGSFLCYFQSLACRQAPRAPVTKYGPAATSWFKQTKMFLWVPSVVKGRWFTTNRDNMSKYGPRGRPHSVRFSQIFCHCFVRDTCHHVKGSLL